MSRLFFVVALIAFSCSHAIAQSAAALDDLTIQIPPSQPWVDTGVDLQMGDVLHIAASQASAGASACNAAGLSGIASESATLPLKTAPEGALLARLAQGAAPVLVGAQRDLKIEAASHLFLGMNFSGKASCQGEITVKIHKAPSGAGNGAGQQQSRGQQLKSQLSSAAQIFMQGQFGVGKTESAASSPASGSATVNTPTPAASLKLSDSPLDPELRKHLDTLPRRVNDQFNNLGDMVNFVIVGSQKDVQAALDAATWHVADTSNTMAAINAAMQTYGSKDYLAMPMSILYLFGRKQDFGYEMAEPIAMVASRHHFRIWKAPFTWKDHEVWVGAGTHDIGFAKDRRNNNVTHKIDPAVDGERDNIGSSLQKANMAKSMSYYLPPNPVQEAKNATGDGYHSDGRLLVIFLQ